MDILPAPHCLTFDERRLLDPACKSYPDISAGWLSPAEATALTLRVLLSSPMPPDVRRASLCGGSTGITSRYSAGVLGLTLGERPPFKEVWLSSGEATGLTFRVLLSSSVTNGRQHGY